MHAQIMKNFNTPKRKAYYQADNPNFKLKLIEFYS